MHPVEGDAPRSGEGRGAVVGEVSRGDEQQGIRYRCDLRQVVEYRLVRIDT